MADENLECGRILLVTRCIDWNAYMSKMVPFVLKGGSCCLALDTYDQLWNVVMNQSKVWLCLRGIV